MGIGFGFLLKDGALQREQWLSQKSPDESRKSYVDAVSKFTKELKIVTGEANSKLFDLKEFADAIDVVFSKEPEAVFKLVFHKNNSEAEALEDFKRNNTHFCELRAKYPERMKIYWTPKRPRQHYAVIDNKVVILEEPNHPSSQPFWATIVKDEEISADWEKRFDTYVSHLQEMPV